MTAREQGACVLLEPWYRFRLVVPADKVGRALTDLTRMAAVFEAPEAAGEMATIEESSRLPKPANMGSKSLGILEDAVASHLSSKAMRAAMTRKQSSKPPHTIRRQTSPIRLTPCSAAMALAIPSSGTTCRNTPTRRSTPRAAPMAPSRRCVFYEKAVTGGL